MRDITCKCGHLAIYHKADTDTRPEHLSRHFDNPSTLCDCDLTITEVLQQRIVELEAALKADAE